MREKMREKMRENIRRMKLIDIEKIKKNNNTRNVIY